MIDSHIHLSLKLFDHEFPYICMEDGEFAIEYGNRKELIEKIKAAGIHCCIEPAVDVDSNRLLLDLSREYPDFLFPAVGNHPTRCINSTPDDFQRVREFAKEGKIIAIGETGLDFHYK